jgi:hypothetical protein
VKLYQQAQTEALFMAQVTDYAVMRGWEFMHIQPGLTERGRYRTPVSGSLGPGWPDLILIRGSDLIAVELKAEGKYPTPIQRRVLLTLEQAAVEVHTWKPSDWPEIERRLA